MGAFLQTAAAGKETRALVDSPGRMTTLSFFPEKQSKAKHDTQCAPQTLH